MFARTFSVAPYGMDIVCVSIETYVAERGFPSFDIVGLPSKEVTESKHRIITALKSSGVEIPPKKIVINLAPADIPKIGSFLDLPIAVSLMATLLNTPIDINALYFGEVSMDGSLRYTYGSFLLALFAKDSSRDRLFLPSDCVSEISSFDDLEIYAVPSLAQLLKHFSGERPINASRPQAAVKFAEMEEDVSIDSVIGQTTAKRATIISVAGGHNLLFSGSPGVGKTMLAKAYRGLLPRLDSSAALEVTKIHSLGRKISQGQGLLTRPPFRSPHHTISYTGMVGGGSVPIPGEVSLAHRGVLFLDEFTEFPRKVLESLRQPLEVGKISITRSKGTFVYPCEFVLVGACNPCPCGYYNHPRKECICTVGQIQNYQRELSGPIMDRIDLYVPLTPFEHTGAHNILSPKSARGNVSTDIKKQICIARSNQLTRFCDSSKLNASMTNKDIIAHCILSDPAKILLNETCKKLELSARVYFKLLKIARTIADLASHEIISDADIAEAMLFRK